LAVYWLKRIKEKNFRIDGQLLLTLGYGLGALAVVFAPGTLHRASARGLSTADTQMLYWAVKKVYDFVRYVCLNPLQVIPVLGVSVGFLFRRSVRERLDSVSRWLLLASLITLFSTLVLSNGLGRTGWCAMVVAFLACARILPNFFPRRCLRPFAWVCYALCAVTVLTTGYVLFKQRVELWRALSEWCSSPDNVVRYSEKYKIPYMSFFVRDSKVLCIHWGIEYPWETHLAKIYGKEACISLDAFLYNNLFLEDKVCLPSNRVENCPGWYFVPGHRGMACLLPAESSLKDGTPLEGEYEYSALASSMPTATYIKQLLKGGRASASSPKGEVHRKVETNGFVLYTRHGKYIVLDADPEALRDSIKNITFKPL